MSMKNRSPLPIESWRYRLTVVDAPTVDGNVALTEEGWNQLDARSYLLELVVNHVPGLFELCTKNWAGLVGEAGFEVVEFEDGIEEDEGEDD